MTKKVVGATSLTKTTAGNRNPVAANVRVNKPKIFKMKTRYDRKSFNGKNLYS